MASLKVVQTDSEDFVPSELGTKEYWDTQYSQEIVNFHEFGDIGEIWFGRQCQLRVINWIEKCTLVRKDSHILDIGCGNGALLNELADRGYSQLTGIDYSLSAIQLATEIGATNKMITFKCCDILDPIPSIGPVDVCIDKGTYDAISLSIEAQKNRLTYQTSVANLLKANGTFIIVSCNWTEEELKKHFSKSFVAIDTVPAPSFQFGGKSGQTTSMIVFKKT